MGKFKKQDTWYGMLETSKGNTVMIWDSIFPVGEKGKVFLYNTGKDAMIEYVEEIVSPKLRDLTGDELDDALKAYANNLYEIKSRYQDDVDEMENSAEPPKGNSETSSVMEDIDDDADVVDDDFEDL